MNKIFIKILLLLSFGFTILNANNSNNIKKEFNNAFNDILLVVKDEMLTKEQRNKKIIDIIDPIFDFELMAKLSLGKTWKKLTSTQKNEFVNLYISRMKKSYSSKIDSFADEEVVINKIKQPKLNRLIMYTSLIGDGEPININYKYYKIKRPKANKKEWLVYDVIIKGISIIKTDRAQFSAIIKRGNILALIDKMK
jgi:phospholipid transport system substrate-binding protein